MLLHCFQELSSETCDTGGSLKKQVTHSSSHMLVSPKEVAALYAIDYAHVVIYMHGRDKSQFARMGTVDLQRPAGTRLKFAILVTGNSAPEIEKEFWGLWGAVQEPPG